MERTPLVDTSISIQNGDVTECLSDGKNDKQFKDGQDRALALKELTRSWQ